MNTKELLAEGQNNTSPEIDLNDGNLGAEAAHLIWQDDPGIEAIIDPRTPSFATAVLDTLSAELAAAPGAMKRAIRTAAKSAERLNVEPFQGLIEVIQNADDLRAEEVRFALRHIDGHRQLLIVHNGKPVTCHHVLGMIIPYFTTKEHDPDQRGRFGIGLKTLARIASSMAIHSHPYHFSGNQETLRRSAEEEPIKGFFSPESDTMIVLELKPGFDESALRAWFEKWDDDGLIFLSSVRSFHWHVLGGETGSRKSVTPGAWSVFVDDGLENGIELIERRNVASDGKTWTVWKARVQVPPDKHPEHKARNDTVHISVAVSDAGITGHLHIGFRTRVPVSLPVSIDAPFDPSTAREGLVEDDWNTWLIDQSANVLAAVAKGMFATTPEAAWCLVPLHGEGIGNSDDTWLSGAFAKGFERVRADLAAHALVKIGAETIPLAGIAYESPELCDLLSPEDLSALSPESHTLPVTSRDGPGRWRQVLDEIGVSHVIGVVAFLKGFSDGVFAAKEDKWWVRAAARLVQHQDDDNALFGAPFWLTDGRMAVSCERSKASARKLVSGSGLSAFATRRQLLDQLHPAYRETAEGQQAVNWLVQNAAFTAAPGPEDELEAFAERYAATPEPVEDAEVREIRDLFDQLSERAAERIGPLVGAAILVDGVTYKNGKPQKIKVSPTKAYLSKTLDGEHPYWPIAAEKIPGLQWVAARYEDQLKTGVGRGRRRRGEDGTMSRGARRFLMLLGAECAPRLVSEKGSREKGATRGRDLTSSGANSIPEDLASPDLERVLDSFAKMSMKERKVRSPALFRCLSRNWNRLYASKVTVRSRYFARTRYHEKKPITASWLCRLKDKPWIAVGKGELAPASTVVVKSPATQPHYPNNAFIVGIELDDVNPDMAVRLSIRTEMRVSDVVLYLENVRDGSVDADETGVMQIYRNLAKLCPITPAWNARVGDLSVQELRRRFGQGNGLIYMSGLGWRRPDQLLRGPDIFHDRQRFVPGGPSSENLWVILAVPTPDLDDCISFCRSLAGQEPDKATTEKLIDVYRYMEPLLADTEKRHRDRLRTLPLVCSEKWEAERPILFVQDEELRQQLVAALPGQRFWTPPCDTRELTRLTSMVGLTRTSPECSVSDQRAAALDQGDALRDRFERAVDLLADELARNDPATRGKLRMGWDTLRAMPLYVYDDAPRVVVRDPAIAAGPVNVRLRALLAEHPLELHVQSEAIALREHGGRAIASLFPPEVRRKIDVEWLAAWMNPESIAAVGLKLASDEELHAALDEEADRINAASKSKIKIKPTAAGRAADVTPRTLKETAGVIATATVQAGSSPKQEQANKPKLVDQRPEPSKPTPPEKRSAPRAFDSTDLEQAGWEVLTKVLATEGGQELEDFRKRHGVGADGALDWKTFIEMKATGRGPASSIEMSSAEYERARKEGMGFMLALVSGLETGEKLEVRLIFDPANRASCKPTNGMRFHSLSEAPAIVVSFDEEESGMETEQ